MAVVSHYLDQYRQYAWLLVGYVALVKLNIGLQAIGIESIQTDGREIILISFWTCLAIPCCTAVQRHSLVYRAY
jgi:hypothetical protein